MSFVYFNDLPVSRSETNRAPSGGDGTGASHHGCAAEKPVAILICSHDLSNAN